MTELMFLLLIVVLLLLAPALGTDSRDPVRGNRGDYPAGVSPASAPGRRTARRPRRRG